MNGIKNTFKKTIQRILTFFWLGVFLYSAYQLVTIGLDYWENRKIMEEIQKEYRPELFAVEEAEESQMIRPQFLDLLKMNGDIVGWITIENTPIDYPILQAEDNDYYLYRNYKHEKTRAGSIFLDFRNDVRQPDRNTIIYGHNMRDGSMFGELDQYLNEEFFQENQIFYFDTLYDSYIVEVFSVYLTTTDFYYIETDFASDEEYLQFLRTIQNKSAIETDVVLDAKDRIITLSTCDRGFNYEKGRLVVHGKLIKQGS